VDAKTAFSLVRLSERLGLGVRTHLLRSQRGLLLKDERYAFVVLRAKSFKVGSAVVCRAVLPGLDFAVRVLEPRGAANSRLLVKACLLGFVVDIKRRFGLN